MNFDIRKYVDQVLAPLRSQVRAMILRALITNTDDTQQVQTADLDLGDEQVPEAERFQPYGLSANPANGAEAVVVFVGASHDHPIVLGTEDRTVRPTGLAKGESALYNGHGTKIVLKASGAIEITVGAGQAVIVNGDVMASGISLKNHTHTPGSYVAGTTAVTGASGTPT